MPQTILIIDDDDILRAFIKQVLEKAYDVFVAADGTEGIMLYRAHRPDLVITDLLMPQLDGMEVLRGIRTHDPGARVIVISGSDKLPVPEMIGDLAPTALLVKPFDHRELLAAVAQALA